MRFLADESLDMAVISALRLDGHDVRAISEEHVGASDEIVAEVAAADQRILLTEDRDFGRLFYAQLQGAHGVLYIRYPAGTRREFATGVVDFIRSEGEKLPGAFVVMQPGRTRISRLPGA